MLSPPIKTLSPIIIIIIIIIIDDNSREQFVSHKSQFMLLYE